MRLDTAYAFEMFLTKFEYSSGKLANLSSIYSIRSCNKPPFLDFISAETTSQSLHLQAATLCFSRSCVQEKLDFGNGLIDVMCLHLSPFHHHPRDLPPPNGQKRWSYIPYIPSYLFLLDPGVPSSDHFVNLVFWTSPKILHHFYQN